ncbi:glycosyltransferase family 2 protein [Bifidobacterium scardovii]|uniref:Glycosyltransferase, group 2 family protein n=1 Tax=Bifidobacterium scardovii TaxID=158787 RepID=A0A087DJB4_9BIFI|nr:glycosyltransferase [Bifidobacterium scardovii]KFI95614.1 glycosyltransferase, group 2 family protein [Bifidobacterium scardovii]MDK6348374.1 glycosyltransferase [Bifidobacterium scardovii]MDU8982865.1 glycosyltransferase [Bifidobacterium scardovii]BAQ32460.1 putative glycosyltransferase [Bifidobacterium scardovii JCM 12489 = DSM 13734]
MPDKPLVSVIVPVYNAERYLHYCVDSILSQSYEHLEVILVDDGAKDSSPSICDQYADKDHRVTVIHQDNGGIAKAQNAGLDAAHGAYIAFADNDDILDRRNIELLLHALLSTNANMSKARWRQFGVSQLEAVSAEAMTGAADPDKITVFQNPLYAYQTVFCKSLRLMGDRFGRNTEARYFNEANWCRLYRRELWDGIRFPEGMYAQDVMVAGELYSRMDKVADIDVNLYNWLQSAGSVTHSERSFGFYHDNAAAGIANFRHALNHGVMPGRSYYTMVGSVAEELTAPDASTPANQRQYQADRSAMDQLLAELTPPQRIECCLLQKIRLFEKHIYDRKIKNLR